LTGCLEDTLEVALERQCPDRPLFRRLRGIYAAVAEEITMVIDSPQSGYYSPFASVESSKHCQQRLRQLLARAHKGVLWH